MIRRYTYWLAVLMMLTACGDDIKVLKTETISLTSLDQIILLEDSLVRPVLYSNIPTFNHLSPHEAKQKFTATVLPAILVAKYHISTDRDRVSLLIEKKNWTDSDSLFYTEQIQRFKAKGLNDLFFRMQTHPNSIVLSQAAVESGWGSSRFLREANNLFGIWSYNADEPRIPATGEDVYLRSYSDISQSIEDYFETIGRSRHYRAFRKARSQSTKIDRLLPHLVRYSSRGHAYTQQLKVIIDQNNLTQYDNYQIDPRYLIEK